MERLHHRLRRVPALRAFTVTVRLLLAVGFIPPGLTKVLGHRFTLIPTTDPIGAFFETFFQAQGFYVFVGSVQVLAGLLLLVPRTALLGALLYLPVITNIFVITVSMGFRGTWIITGLMLLANLYLLAWDYPRLRGIVRPGMASPAEPSVDTRTAPDLQSRDPSAPRHPGPRSQ